MHQHFAEWYRQAGLEPNADELPKRWTAVEEYAPDHAAILALVAVFNFLEKPTDHFPSGFTAALQNADATFKTRDNDQEFAVLAGAELVDVMARGKNGDATLATLSVVCAAAGNARPLPAVRDIPEIGARELKQRAQDRAKDGCDSEHPSAAGKLLEPFSKLGAHYATAAQELCRVQQDLAVVSEETNMLWWLFSERSRDAEQRWEKFSVPATALMAGKELADLTRIAPGPLAAPAFLDRLIRSAKRTPPASVRVIDAVNQVTRDWREKFVAAHYLQALEHVSPITHAIKLSLDSPDDSSWLPAFSERTKISRGAALSPHVLSYQLFLESVLSRLWRELQ